MKNFNLKNSLLKNKLSKNEITIGSWLTIPSQSIVEILSTAGFEWLTIDIEHSPISIESVKNLIGHIQGNGMQALVRVSENNETIIKRVLDAGADGVIIPMVNSIDDAKKAVNSIKYPPIGNRGVGLNRAQKFGTDFKKYVEWQEKNVVIIFQIEHIKAVKNLEDILKVKHLDGIMVGPYDLSSSMGYPGQYNRSDVKSALKKIEQIVKKHKKSLGFHIIESDHSHTLKKISEGYNLIAFSMDFFFMGDMARNEMNKLKNVLK